MTEPILHNADCLDAMRAMKPESVTAIVTDPPYGLVEPRSLRSFGYALEHGRTDADKAARRGGFMGKSWDHGVPGVPFWEAALRVAKPGAMLLAFGGTRTHHRLMAAIEDAGWEIRDCVMWLYGSGFPKSHSIGKAIDKAAIIPCPNCHATGKTRNPDAVGTERGTPEWEDYWLDVPCPKCGGSGKLKGAEREVVGPNPHARPIDGNGSGYTGPTGHDPYITAPATPAAQLWEGYGTALKPAVEICVVAMKPLAGTFAANALEHGVAGINVDGCRVGHNEPPSYGTPKNTTQAFAREGQVSQGYRPEGPAYSGEDGWNTKRQLSAATQGRWPANLIWSHVPDTDCPACSGDYPACKLCGGAGMIRGCVRRGVKRVKGGPAPYVQQTKSAGYGTTRLGNVKGQLSTHYADADGLETVEDYDCHPDCPSRGFPDNSGSHGGGTRTNGGRGRGWGMGAQDVEPGKKSSGSASRYFYCAKSPKRERWFYCRDCKDSYPERERKDHGHGHVDAKGKQTWDHVAAHPTVKPLALMQYLVRLVTMPENTIILDPFMGSGTTGVACVAEGVDFIGIEQDPESFATAKGRIEVAQQQEEERLFV